MGDWKMVDSMITDGLWDVYNKYHMGITAENVAKKYDVSREKQDALALGSQQKAAAAQEGGRFKDEIVPFSIRAEEGRSDRLRRRRVHQQEDQRRSARRPAAGVRQGRHGDRGQCLGPERRRRRRSCVMTAQRAQQLGLTPLARIASYATVALDPSIMGMGPVPASQKALRARRLEGQPSLDLLEINEAFAAQACAVNNEMGWDTSKVNVNGGAIAIGHPIGASGCRILVTLLHEMGKRNAEEGHRVAVHRRWHGRCAVRRAMTAGPATIATDPRRRDTCLRHRRHGRHRHVDLPAPAQGRLQRSSPAAGRAAISRQVARRADGARLSPSTASVGNVGDWDSTVAAFQKVQRRARPGRRAGQQRRHHARRHVPQDDRAPTGTR